MSADASLLKRLLDLYRLPDDLVSASQAVLAFFRLYGIGVETGKKVKNIRLREHDRVLLAQLIRKEWGVDPDQTDRLAWSEMTRAQSLAIGSNEKLSSRPVRASRMAIKPYPGQILHLNGRRYALGEGENLDVDGDRATLDAPHDAIIVVENWEVFEHMHALSFDIGLAAKQPAIVFRGSPAYPLGCTQTFVERSARPVYGFVDFDPAGLANGAKLPNLAGLIEPPRDELEKRLAACTNRERYHLQLPQSAATLNAMKTSDNPVERQIHRLWEIVRAHGVALPHECFIQC